MKFRKFDMTLAALAAQTIQILYLYVRYIVCLNWIVDFSNESSILSN